MAETRKTVMKRWQAFVAEYIKDFNGRRAYEDCGAYTSKGNAARVHVARLLGNPTVQELIKQEIDARNTRLHLEQDKVVLEQLRLAMSDMRNYLHWGPDGVRLKHSDELTEDQAAAVAEVSETITKEGGTIRFKLHSKSTALDSLFRHLGLYEADNHRVLDFGVVAVPVDSDDESWDEMVEREVNANRNGAAKNNMATE